LSNLTNISGSGTILSNTILSGYNEYVGLPPITTPPNNILIQFYTMSNLYIDSYSVFSEYSTNIGIQFDENIIGGLNEFVLTLSRKSDIQPFNQMIVKLFMDNIHWYTGMIDIKPTLDTVNDVIDYKGFGLIKLLDREKINLVYQAVSVKYILDDLIGTQMITTDVYYDASLINPPDITITKLEFNNKTLLECIDKLLEICNVDFQNYEYRYYIDVNRTFVFESINKSVIVDHFHEGYAFQKPESQIKSDKIINQVSIFRTQEDSQVVEWIDTRSDTISIIDYGLYAKKITIKDYADVSDATKISDYLIERYKAPIKVMQLNNMIVTEPLVYGSYLISNAIREYVQLLSDCSSLTDWTLNTVYTSVTIESTIVESGRNCFKIVTQPGSVGESIELDLADDQINFPEFLDIWIRQEIAGMFLYMEFLDEYGNTTTYATVNAETEAGELIITESGDYVVCENGAAGIQVDLIEQFNKYSMTVDTSQIKSLRKIRIYFVTNAANTFYIDRIECRRRQYLTSNVVLRKVKYKIDKGVFSADSSYGELSKSGVDDIKELNDETKTIQSIFEKS
jgi:hypothetical protein